MLAPIYQITVMSQKYCTNDIIFLSFNLTFDVVRLVGFYYRNKNHFHLFHHVDLNAFLPTTFADTSLHYHIRLGSKQVKWHISSGLDSPGLGHPTVKCSAKVFKMIFWWRTGGTNSAWNKHAAQKIQARSFIPLHSRIRDCKPVTTTMLC
jgi:hypothetical protein